MKYICNHKDDKDCIGCRHAKPHDKIEISPFDEFCNERRGVCFTPRTEVQCVPVKGE